MTAEISFDVPNGAAAKVHIIDSGFRLSGMPTNFLLSPEMKGFDELPALGSWSFLVESSTGRKVLFDLGGPSDVNSFPPSVAAVIEEVGVAVKGTTSVAELLMANGVELSDIESVVWSHGHWDHVGDITAFPPTTNLVVGPGFKNEFLPGYPTKQDVELPERCFKSRNLHELEFVPGQCHKVGAFSALDFFGDGSFFILDTPGHAVGHLSGLARTTTNPDTFIFMGGDLCHHGAELRPSAHLPIPAKIHLCPSGNDTSYPDGALFRASNVSRDRKPDEPFFDPALATDLPRAIKTIKDAQEADSQDNVFFLFAHDMGICGVVDFFPKPVNNWKNEGWREKTLWNFLADLAPSLISCP